MSGAVRDPLIHAVASLRAAISLLRAGGKKAAVSDCMFAQMLVDYERAADCAAEALTTPSQGLDAATVERCAREAAALAFDARARKAKHPDVITLERHHAKVIRQGEGDDYDAVQAARIALERFAALATDPHQHGGKGA